MCKFEELCILQSIHHVGKNWVCICKFELVKHSLHGWLAKPLLLQRMSDACTCISSQVSGHRKKADDLHCLIFASCNIFTSILQSRPSYNTRAQQLAKDLQHTLTSNPLKESQQNRTKGKTPSKCCKGSTRQYQFVGGRRKGKNIILQIKGFTDRVSARNLKWGNQVSF